MLRNTRRSGVVMVWVVLIAMVLLGVAALAGDLSYAYFSSQKLQIAADAAALAGAGAVKVDTLTIARQQAFNTAAGNTVAGQAVMLDLNGANAPGGEIVVGYYSRSRGTFTPTTTGANAMQVAARRPSVLMGPIALVFGNIFPPPTAAISRTATAMTIGGTGAGIIALNPHAPDAFYMHGNCVLNLPDGGIQVNSDNQQPILTSGNPIINVPDINVVSETGSVGGNTTFSGNLNLGQPFVPDPLAFLQNEIPPFGDLLHVPAGHDVTIGPGYYPDGIKLTTGTLRLQPGIYVFSGRGLEVTGGNMTGEGVMIYVTGGGKTQIEFTGNGSVDLTPMTDGPYAGVTLYQDVNLHSEVTLNGTDQLHIRGTLYFPGAHASVGGTGDGFGDQLIADTIEVYGNGVININYNGSFPITGIVFLVK